MSEPITISVRDLTAEHIGWRLRYLSLTDMATGTVQWVQHFVDGTTIKHDGNQDPLRLEVSAKVTLTPPPPPDPWEDVDLEAYMPAPFVVGY